MAYTYHDWASRATAALKLAALELHLAEVALEINANVSADGMSRDNSSLVTYNAQLLAERDKLKASPAVRTNGGVSVARFVGPG